MVTILAIAYCLTVVRCVFVNCKEYNENDEKIRHVHAICLEYLNIE